MLTKFPHYISHFGYSIFCSLKKNMYTDLEDAGSLKPR